jgi:hypothetical protein
MEYIAVCIYMRYKAEGFVLRQRAPGLKLAVLHSIENYHIWFWVTKSSKHCLSFLKPMLS